MSNLVNLPIKLNIDDSFFKDEVRNGYCVSEMMKKVWAVELDLLAKVLEVCDKHRLRVFSFAGTTLGAVRHNGFVPWDDDIDLVLMRKDYDRLCEVASEEFLDPYFFQTEDTDSGSLRGHAQLRNSKTTGILSGESRNDINQGIFIDIFPFDNVVDDKELFADQVKKIKRYMVLAKRHYKYAAGYRHYKRNLKAAILHLPLSIANIIYDYKKMYIRFEKECVLYNGVKTKKIGTISRFYDNPRFIFDREDFSDSIMFPFEMIEIPVCVGYEKVLTNTYGNWKELIIAKNEHGSVHFETTKSYKDYLMEKDKYR